MTKASQTSKSYVFSQLKYFKMAGKMALEMVEAGHINSALIVAQNTPQCLISLITLCEASSKRISVATKAIHAALPNYWSVSSNEIGSF